MGNRPFVICSERGKSRPVIVWFDLWYVGPCNYLSNDPYTMRSPLEKHGRMG